MYTCYVDIFSIKIDISVSMSYTGRNFKNLSAQKGALFMILIGYGRGQQHSNWKVRDFTPPSWCRIYYIISGKVQYQCNGTIRHLKPGNFYIFPSYASYTIDHDPADPINCLWLHLDLFPTLVQTLIEIRPQGTLYYLIQALLTEIQPDTGHLPQNSLHTSGRPLIISLCEAFLSYCEDRKYLNPPDEKIAPILQYIMEHYEEPLPIQNIGLRFGYSQEHLIRIFKKRLGITPHQYLIGCRMNQALLLLRHNYTIHEIALRCGYPDGKTFSNAFSNRYGFSPSSFRKMLIRQP